MKIKALVFGLLIAGATVLAYTAIDSENGQTQAVDKTKIKVPSKE
ncbi:MAG: hypothetical protein ACJARZ_001081 [Dokdonia sp.]|jgi:hypothetical protein